MPNNSEKQRNIPIKATVQGVLLCFIFHFVVSRTSHWSVRSLESTPLRYVGWLSYSLYLIHLPVQIMLSTALPRAGWWISPAGLVVSLIYAAIVRRWIELR